MKPPSPANRFRPVPSERFHRTVCLRLPRRFDELSTCVLRAARWRCQCWRGHSRLIDRRWWCAGCSRLRTKWLAGRRAENFLRCAGRENGAFRRRWFLRGGGARKKAAGTSKKCAWSRSERQPFCGGLALNDWRAEAAQRGRLGAMCPCVPTMCPHACRYRYLWCAARRLSRWLREHALSLLSFARSFHVAGQLSHIFFVRFVAGVLYGARRFVAHNCVQGS